MTGIPETFAQQCAQCGDVVDMILRGRWEVRGGPEGPPERWSAGQCPSCYGACLFVQEYFGAGYGDDGWDGYYRMYPPQVRLGLAVPRRLREDHAEASRCLTNKTYKAAAVMARRVLEGITVERGYAAGDLFSRLKQMRDDGVIDADLYDWADICRDVGNQGAHADKTPVTREDAQQALEFVEALLDYLYVFRGKYAEFKKRRDSAKKAEKKSVKKKST